MNQATETAGHDPANGSNNESSATQRAASIAHEAVDSAAAKAARAEKKLRDGVSEAEEALGRSQQLAAERIEQSITTVEKFVKQRPVAAAGIAFAVGVLTTAMLRR